MLFRSDTCEGFEIPANVYECKHILKEYGGVTLNSVVMKQVHGSDDLIFSLSKADCRSIGIAFEPKLQLFPMGLNWKRLRETLNIVFDPVNMGTYKPSPKDNTIHQMHVVLENIRQNSNACIQTPLGKKILLPIFLETITFKFKNKELQKRFPITYKTLTDKENSERVVINDGIGFMLYFGAGEGISPKDFNGKTIDQLIEVSWIDPSLPSSANIYNNSSNPYYINNEVKRRIFFPPI